MIELSNGSYSIEPIPNFVKVGNYSSIAQGVIFHSYRENHLCSINHECVYTTSWDQPQEEKTIEIGNDVWICSGVRILSGMKIGDGAIIAAGAVVNHSVDPYAVVVGNPGETIRYRFTLNQVEELLRLKWWNWSFETIMERKEDMKNIDLFLDKYA